MAELKPRKVIVLTMTLAVQTKVSMVLHRVLGIDETFPRPQQFIMKPEAYGIFVAECAKLEDPPTLKQIAGEYKKLDDVPNQVFINRSGWDAI